MDFYRNLSVVTGGGGGAGAGGFSSSNYPQEQLVVSPSSTTYSKLGVVSSSCCSVDDLFSTQNMEQEAGDVNTEWLSNLVEDCLSNTGNCTYQPLPTNDHHQPLNVKKHYSPAPLMGAHKIENQSTTTTPTAPPSLQNYLSIPTGNTTTKRKRSTKLPRNPLSRSTSSINKSSSSSWSSHHQEEKDPQNQHPNHHVVMSPTTSEYMTPPLLVHQAYWLADSELINVPQNENTNNTSTFTTFITSTVDEYDEQEEIMMKMEEEEESRRKDSSSSSLGNPGQPRRCAHCLSQRTPQWRAGPLGPKTLCNACGVRFKSGRLLPEYRPAKSPTFVSYKHSNSHKKVLEMRMSVLPSSIHTA